MGTVYEGVHAETGEPAAVKLLAESLVHEPDFRHRFEAEIETLRKLNHPNIVRLFGFGEEGEHLFYAMELVTGSSLEKELGRGRIFSWREVLGIGIELAQALRHAHDRGVIHRDIKPGNLLLTAEGQVKLSDFGIARLFGSRGQTTAGSVLGTAEFMAPEQADGRAGRSAQRPLQLGRGALRAVDGPAAVPRQVAPRDPFETAARTAAAAGRTGPRRAGRVAAGHRATAGERCRGADSHGRGAGAATGGDRAQRCRRPRGRLRSPMRPPALRPARTCRRRAFRRRW